jgi:hypothetical protein
VVASQRTVARAAEDTAEAFRGTAAQVGAAVDIAEARPSTVAKEAVGLQLAELAFAEVILAEQPLAEQPMARPVLLPPGQAVRLRTSRRSARCFPSDRHNCCRMPYSILSLNQIHLSGSAPSLVRRLDCHDAAFHIGHALRLGSQSKWRDVDGLSRRGRALEDARQL